MTHVKASTALFSDDAGAANASKGDSRPVLVTGLQRTGTTWLGKMLGLSPSAHYVFEPFNICDQIRSTLWGMNLPTFYTYIHNDNAHTFSRALDAVTSLRCMPVRAACRAGSVGIGLSYLRESLSMFRSRARGAKAVIKDPNLFFAAPYLASRYNMHVVVTIRHPGAFVASNMRLDWTNDFQNFLRQPRLMADFFPGIEDQMRRAAAGDIIDQSILLWNMFHDTITRFQREHPDWIFVRHEDMAADPHAQLHRLFDRLGLTWEPRVSNEIDAHTGRHNPAEAPVGVDQHLHRDSAASAHAWKRHLVADQIGRIREGVEPIASRFYKSADWEIQ